MIGRAPTEPCCYGFVHDRPIAGAVWKRAVQKPFRGLCLWLFGEPDVVLRSLKMGSEEQLSNPLNLLTIAMFVRPVAEVDPEMLLRLIKLEPETHETSEIEPGVRTVQLYGARAMGKIDLMPKLELLSIGKGVELALTCTGRVRGVVLVGEQIR